MKITTFNKLKKYESYLYTAKNANFVRGLTNAQIEDLITAGEDIDINAAELGYNGTFKLDRIGYKNELKLEIF